MDQALETDPYAIPEEGEATVIEPGIAVQPVAGQAGIVGHQRITGTGQTIKQGRFADVRPADQGDDGEHWLSL